MSEKWSKEEVANKVDWEGGLLDALYWGIRADMIEDQELAEAWAELEKTMPVFDKVRSLLPDLR